MASIVAHNATDVKRPIEFGLNDRPSSVAYNAHSPIWRQSECVWVHSERVNYIPEWIEFIGTSQAALARAIGVDKGTVSKWCKRTAGAIQPERGNVVKIAAFLGIEPEMLFRHPSDRKLQIPEELAEQISTLLQRDPARLQHVLDYVRGQNLLSKQLHQESNSSPPEERKTR